MEKTNDAYKGQFAAKVSTIFSYMNFKIGVIEKQKDLIPAHSFPDSIKRRCKYLPKGNDSAMVRYTLVDYQESIDFSIRLMGDLKKLGPASQYKPFQLLVLYNGDQRPDSPYILFSSGQFIRVMLEVSFTWMSCPCHLKKILLLIEKPGKDLIFTQPQSAID